MVKKTRPKVTDYWWSSQMATLHNLQHKGQQQSRNSDCLMSRNATLPHGMKF